MEHRTGDRMHHSLLFVAYVLFIKFKIVVYTDLLNHRYMYVAETICSIL